MTENGLITKAHANQIKSMQSINEMIAGLNSDPTIQRDNRGKEYISIRQIEANLDSQFGPDAWSWEIKSFQPLGSVGLDSNQNPMIGVYLQGDLTVCFPGGNCKTISGVVTDFVSRGTLRNAKGNKGSILSSMALKNAAAKLGRKYGRGYFDGYVAEEVFDAIESVTAAQVEEDLKNIKTREKLEAYWPTVPKQFKAEGSKIHKIFSAKGKQLAAQSKQKANA